MEKGEKEQLDLFLGAQDNPDLLARRIERKHFVARIWGYEKTILLLLCFLVVGIVAFSLGVEKGRKGKIVSLEAVPKPVIKEVVLQKESPAESAKEDVSAGVSPAQTELKEGYTIQVATFNTRNYAQKEVDLLSKRGYKAFIVTKGKHIIVCVGNFSDKTNAQPVLSELGRYYKGCYIRRL